MKKLHSIHDCFLTIAETACDRCGAVMPAGTTEFHESLSIDQCCGQESIFGEGKILRLDLCQKCVQEALGKWMRVVDPIAPGQVRKLTDLITNVQNTFANDQDAIDEWMDTCSNALGGESPNDYLERTGETEAIVRLLHSHHGLEMQTD